MRTRIMVGSAVAIGLLLSACTGKAPADDSAGSSTFTYANNLAVMSDWDPATSYGSEVIAMNNLYEQLTRFDNASGKVKPLLAKSWTSSKDGKTWTFTLREGVKFTTGNRADASAVKAALDRTRKVGQGAAHIWDSVKSIEAPTPTELVFNLTYPAPLDLVASSSYAAFIYDTRATTGDLHAWFEKGQAAGTGPYLVKDWKKGQQKEVTLGKNAAYWKGWSGRHYTRVVFQNVPQETTAAQMVQTGEASFVPNLSSSLFASMAKKDGVNTVQGSSFQNLLAMLNTASGPLADRQLRRAVAQTIDYAGIVDALKGSVVQAQGVVPKGLIGYTTDIKQVTDTAEAKALLATKGYSPSNPLKLTLTYAAGTPQLDTVVSLMKSNLAAVGIELQAKSLAWQAQSDMGKSKDRSKRQDIFLLYWFPDYADPFSWFAALYHSSDEVAFNFSYWDDSAADATIDQLPSLTATDREAVQSSYVDLQKTISDEAVSPILGVVQFQRALASSVTGYEDNPAYSNVVFVHDLTPTS